MVDTNKDGGVQGEQSPQRYSQKQASEFIANTSLDTMLDMAAEAVRRKQLERASEGPKWVFPEDGIKLDS
ncbi:MAG: hypothetical protein AAGC93_19720 [Cyanobacteria bacterium P01_F01_bin.53]